MYGISLNSSSKTNFGIQLSSSSARNIVQYKSNALHNGGMYVHSLCRLQAVITTNRSCISLEYNSKQLVSIT